MTSKNKPHNAKKISFTIVDALIVFAILISIAYIIYVHVLGHSISDIGAKCVEIEYSVKIEDVDPDYYSKIKIGDTVKTSDGSRELGAVTSISPIARNQSITVTIKAEAYERNGLYEVNEIKIGVDEQLSIRFLNYAPSEKVKCTHIKVN